MADQRKTAASDAAKRAKAKYKRKPEVRARENARRRTPEARAKQRARQKARAETEPQYVVARRLRCRLWHALKRRYGDGKRSNCSLGVDWNAVVDYLGEPPDGWANREGWHIDHIRPLASFDLTDPEQVRAACAPENHQWLPAAENIAKGAKMPPCGS